MRAVGRCFLLKLLSDPSPFRAVTADEVLTERRDRDDGSDDVERVEEEEEERGKSEKAKDVCFGVFTLEGRVGAESCEFGVSKSVSMPSVDEREDDVADPSTRHLIAAE